MSADTTRFYRAEVPTQNESLGVIVHPSPKAKAVLINCPGYRGDIDGYKGKYRVIAGHISKLGLAAVIQMPNVERPTSIYGAELVEDVKAAIRFACSIAHDVCAAKRPEIWLMGFSAGGYAVAAAANHFPSVTKLLLMEPSANPQLMGPFPAKQLARFNGEAYIVVGDDLQAVGPGVGRLYQKAFANASKCKLEIIRDCDHQFRGTANGQILAKAPLWAFAGDDTFPKPDGGLVLY